MSEITGLTERGVPVELHYSKRLCPILSLPTLATQPRQIVDAAGTKPAGPSFIACKGMACMLFVPAINETGEIQNGLCAATQIAQNGTQLTHIASAAFERFLRPTPIPKGK
jgi:hypothetical protein